MSTVIVNRLMSGRATTTSTTIACTPNHTSTGGHVSLTALQKCIIVVHQLAYGMAADMIDEYLKLEKSTAHECLEYYCSGIIERFGDEFLRRPTIADTQRLVAKAEERGFPGILGSIDCMH
jgi:hypothetical protein